MKKKRPDRTPKKKCILVTEINSCVFLLKNFFKKNIMDQLNAVVKKFLIVCLISMKKKLKK